MTKTRIIEVMNEEYGYGKVHIMKSTHVMPTIHFTESAPTHTTACDEQFNERYENFNFDGKGMKNFTKCRKCFKESTD